jgi:hypothetical protein
MRPSATSHAARSSGVVDVVRGTVCEVARRRENCDVTLLEQQLVVDAGGHVLHVSDHCGVDLPLKQEVDESLRCALAQLDVKSRDELYDLSYQIEDERRRDKGRFRYSVARSPCVGAPGLATDRFCRGQ